MEYKNNMEKTQSNLLDLVYVSLMAAMVFIATSVIHIPSFNGVIHAGDSMVFVAAVVLGKRKGAIASGLGMFLFDVLHGYMTWAPFTLVIKAVMALIAAIMWERVDNKKFWNQIMAFSLSGLWMIGAYFISGAFIKLFFSGEGITFVQALVVSSYDIMGNILQVLVGILIAVPLLKALPLVKSKI